MSKYIVMTASAKMPSSCWGEYAHVAVVELEDGFEGMPRMISERARGVRRIIEKWENLNVGKTSRCAFRRALTEAEALVASLSRGES